MTTLEGTKVAVSARKETTMNPGSEWVVEFAVRERRAREHSTWARAVEEEVPDLAGGTQWFRQPPVRRIHHLLLVFGTLFSRQAPELLQASVERAPLRGRAAGCDRRQRSTKPERRELGRADFQARLDQ